MHLSILGLLAACSMIALLATTRNIAFADDTKNAPATQPAPSPDQSPKDVVMTIVEALGKNDANDSGIKVAWIFASPENKKVTGPLQKFIPMVKNPAYAPLLNHKSAGVKEIAVKDDQAAELATITDDTGFKTYFIFQLSKQTEGNLKDCWMTDGVIQVQPQLAPGKLAPKPPDGQLPT
jgi:hypothetical protein